MYDVIVAGAGPAGSTCARICAQAGLAVLLLDKDVFPREKPCGGAVSMQALSWLDFPLPDDVVEKKCFGARISYNGRLIEARKERPFAVLVSRGRFDRVLAEKAVACGAEFRMGEKVAVVREAEGSVFVITDKNTYNARFVVGADGVHSSVARCVRPRFRQDEIVLASVSRVAAGDDEIDQRLHDEIAIRFGIAPLGYGWLFPHRGYFSLGAAGLASEFSDPRKILAEYGRTVAVEPGAVRGHFIPLGGIRRRIASGRILLAGDAAGFADPFHGEGIAHAILSGRLAAEEIAESCKTGRGPALAAVRYSRRCEQRIRKQLRVALAMARFLDRHPKLFLRIFFDNNVALVRYLDIPSGRIDYRGFLRWLVVRIPFLLGSSLFKELRRTSHGSRSG